MISGHVDAGTLAGCGAGVRVLVERPQRDHPLRRSLRAGTISSTGSIYSPNRLKLGAETRRSLSGARKRTLIVGPSPQNSTRPFAQDERGSAAIRA